MWRVGLLLILTAQIQTEGKLDSDEDTGESGDRDLRGEYNVTSNHTGSKEETEVQIDDSAERIGAAITQVVRHPYAAALLKNDSYVCSAIILNNYWVLTLSKCFESSVISSYVTHRYLGNYTIRAGSSYNNKGGAISKIKMLINNFDLKVSAAKLEQPLKFTSQIQSVLLPKPDEDVSLGYLASMIAWTPTGALKLYVAGNTGARKAFHSLAVPSRNDEQKRFVRVDWTSTMYKDDTVDFLQFYGRKHIRVVNSPVIDSSICEPSTKLLPGRYVCVGGVQDPNRHFCRKDNGGAVIQNNTLIAISSFLHTCALYTKTHAFPKVSSFSRWLDSVIWDENNRPTTTLSTSFSSTTTTSSPLNTTESVDRNMFVDPRKYMLTLPFDPINVPLEPAEDNSVIPRMSLYESYLQNLVRVKTSTTADPNGTDEKKEWFEKFGKSLLRMPPQAFKKKYDNYDY